ncbi:MAG: endopeptidase La [Ignavibacteria bacterium]|nr:endopeptidase La [Ignavibacteria bacterium]
MKPKKPKESTFTEDFMPEQNIELTDVLSVNSHRKRDIQAVPKVLPVLPLKDIVILPYMVYPILAGRESSIKAINSASDTEQKFIFLVAQKDSSIEQTDSGNLYTTGTVAKIMQIMRMPNGLIKILVDGFVTAKAVNYFQNDFINAEIEIINDTYENIPEIGFMSERISKLFSEFISLNPLLSKDLYKNYEKITEFDRKLYYILTNLPLDVRLKQRVIDVHDISIKYFEIVTLLISEIQIQNIEKEIETKVQSSMQKNQKKFILQEQIRILQDELGDSAELDPDLAKLKKAIENADMPENVKAKANEEFEKLKKTPPMSPDFSVSRNYLEWMTSVPWNVFTDDNYDLDNAQKILDEDHYGLEKPKERILELLAVLKILKDKNIKKPPKGQILCFVGPPGVGKTSLGKSIARALNRKFARLSVGGVKDEAEIRGHRRTYIGSMPGRIIQAMKKAGTSNPVILIDEIDKMGNDFRGDPASAMLEVLDPEQNNTFNDHYLDIDYDLSNVLFITTANVQYNIPLALQDRMEIIEMRSYLDFEKIQIAKRHILPKELAEHGLDADEVKFSDDVIQKIIREYTREAGVRNLERELTSVIRKVTKEKLLPSNRGKQTKITPDKVEKFLGVPKFEDIDAKKEEKTKIGSVYGLAWTSLGGDILTVDVTIMKGSNKITLTGKLGDVMKESAIAGLSYIKSNSKKFGIPDNYFKDKEIHIHVPEGAIPKDGPSAGITMIMGMLSAITQNPVRTDIAMTGEITLRGNVLPVGGLNEKLLAAVRSGIKCVIIPKDNEKNIAEIPKDITSKIRIIPVSKVEEGIDILFGVKKLVFRKK